MGRTKLMRKMPHRDQTRPKRRRAEKVAECRVFEVGEGKEARLSFRLSYIVAGA